MMLLAIVLMVLALWWFWPSPVQEQQQGPRRFSAPTDLVPVAVATVRQADFPVYLKALGTVTAYNTVSVRSRVEGELVKILFEEGQEVRQGQLLAVIDPRPYEVALQQAEGTLAENQALLRNAQVDLRRYKELYAQDSIARQTLDTQEARVSQYQGVVKGNQAQVAQARLNLAFTRIEAPIDGRLGLRQLDLGNLVNSGDSTPLVVITQTRPIAVQFTLPETEAARVVATVRQGKQLSVQAWDRGENRQLADGQLQSLDNQIDTATGTLKLKARFENAEESLFPNQFVNVRLLAETLDDAIQLPAAAIQYGSGGTFAYVVGEGDSIQIRPLVLGPGDGSSTVILSGVAAGERVVVEGTDRLREGTRVEVVGSRDQVPASPAEQLQGGASGDEA